MNHFWTHRDNIPDGLGYGQFTRKHFMWMAVIFLLVGIVTAGYMKADAFVKLIILRGIAVALILIDTVKMIVIAKSEGVKVSDYLPLEMCSFGAYFIVCDSAWPENPFFKVMLLTLFLPGAFMAVLFPTTSPLPALNFYTIHQFVYHGLIVAYVIARFACGEIPLIYSNLWPSIAIILLLVGSMYIIDTVFKKNYMFLCDPYGNPLLGAIWRMCKGGIGYTLGLVAFSIFMIHVFFGIFKCIELIVM